MFSFIKIKFFTILIMVFMGLFSRLVLGFPLLLPFTSPAFHSLPHHHHFPESGNRNSLRLMPTARYAHKRRCAFKNGQTFEEETTLLHEACEDNLADFTGEFTDSKREYFHQSLGLALI